MAGTAAIAHDTWSLDEDQVVTASLEDAQAHDAFWAEAHAHENYFRPGLDYEDYAPAYCVGYVGFVQYGGTFEDAEKCLLSNWVRIRGDSRLSLDEARMAMRAAWERAAMPADVRASHSMHVDTHASGPFAVAARRFLSGANAWLERLFGQPAASPIARRAQQGGIRRY